MGNFWSNYTTFSEFDHAAQLKSYSGIKYSEIVDEVDPENLELGPVYGMFILSNNSHFVC